MTTAAKCIELDLKELRNGINDSPIIFVDQIDDNNFHLEAAISGPNSTPYQGGVFLLDIKLTEEFPFAPPQSVTFKRAMMHPNVDECGKFISNLLTKEKWLPSMTLKAILEHVWARLAVPDIDSEQCDPTRAPLYQADKKLFEDQALYWSQIMQQSPPITTPIKTMQLKEVPLDGRRRKKLSLCSLPIRLTLEILLILLLFVPAIMFLMKWPTAKSFIHGKVLSKTRLAPASDGLESWSNPPVKTVRAYRLFDITNHMDIMTKTNNPMVEFQETIPMHYRVVIKKNNVEWLNDHKNIHYSVERIFTREGEFNETILNQEGAFVDILRVMFRTKFNRVADSVFYILGGNNAFNHSKAVDKLEGYISPLFAAISARMQGPNREKYGFIYRYNGSNGFNFTIDTGLDQSTNKGRVVDFASEYTSFETKASDWQTTFFDGLTFPPLGNPTTRKVINVFQPDFCRPVQLRYNRTVSMFGIDQVHEYVLKLVDYESCPQMDETCPEADKLDITKCLSSEIPPETVFLTKPHMYGHNSSATNVAFTPDADKHESTIYFEPLSGTPLLAQLRIQLNANAWIDRIKVSEDGTTNPTNSRAVRRFIPMMWIDQRITLNDETLNRLKRVSGILQKGHSAHQSLKLVYILVALFSTVAIIVVIELLLWRRQQKINRRFLHQSNDQEKSLLSHTLTTSPMTA
ncbi:unnamed protein product [Adineta ricciae]|uniref:UBC core domain-containing protein n=2 Tax=Adineta ricciae TaxID=249248 RepID=A0A814CY63_ADIRI|nr:unnamed protein product [Adineta ricciae]